MTASRVLAVLAAICLVVAFALATLLPPPLTLAQLVAMFDARMLYESHQFVVAHGMGWLWSNLLMPLLLRPCWLLPIGLGLVFAGGALTLGSRKGVPRSHRRRS
ncbi:MAG: hypothetical protein M0Z28_02220 [Rhodospirillales bacterium]|nr:hypothetical protein [Rhodospirillales bacterium]